MKIFGQLENAGLEQLKAPPTPAYPGRMYIDINNPAAAIPKMYNGSIWSSIAISYQQTAYDVINASILVTVASSAMTIALKQQDGATDPSASAPVYASFRSTVANNASYTQGSVSAALSLVVPSGATLGTQSTVQKYLWVYLINNAGTLELAVSGARYDDGSIQSTTTISSGATSSSVIYSATGRASKAIKLIGRMLVTEAAAGTWASLPTETTMSPKNGLAMAKAVYLGSNTTYANGNIIQYPNKVFDNYNAVTTGSNWLFTCPVGCAGLYKLTICANVLSAVTTGWVLNVASSAYSAYLNPTVGKTMTSVACFNLQEGQQVQITATGALQMDTSVANTPQIIIEQIEWA